MIVKEAHTMNKTTYTTIASYSCSMSGYFPEGKPWRNKVEIRSGGIGQRGREPGLREL
jgi:hypothetical protein